MSREEVGERISPDEVVYFLGPVDGDTVKIGHTRDLETRWRELQAGNPEKLSLLGFAPGGRVEEARFHQRFAADRIRGEWFKRSPALNREMVRLLKAGLARRVMIVDGVEVLASSPKARAFRRSSGYGMRDLQEAAA